MYKIACLEKWYCEKQHLKQAINELKQDFDFKKITWKSEISGPFSGFLLYIKPHNDNEYCLIINNIQYLTKG